ncbi:hypothetical protein ABMA27_007406 [Loxostege sticticalis]|uniref:LITAF domain-containing protein n=1 Tax=Loxostege sticticalis TaxID=481309 RepID=A0ABR3HF95_LOXSC
MDSSSTKIVITNSGNNSTVQNQSAPPEMSVESETVDYIREPPPPYTITAQPAANQPSVIQQTITIQAPLKDKPAYFTCGVCKETSLTKVEYVNTQKTHMFAGFICGCTMWCFMCCFGALPYLIPTCKNAKHYCPNCDNFLGDYSRF